MDIMVKVSCLVHNGLQTPLVLLNGSRPHEGVKTGYTEVDISTWLELKSTLTDFVSKGIISVEPIEEAKAIEEFKSQCFAEYEVMGIPAVKASFATGKLSKGVQRVIVTEWLEGKVEVRDTGRSQREAETLSIAKEANQLASEANSIARIEAAAASRSARWAMYAAIIAALGAIIATQDKIFLLIFGHP